VATDTDSWTQADRDLPITGDMIADEAVTNRTILSVSSEKIFLSTFFTEEATRTVSVLQDNTVFGYSGSTDANWTLPSLASDIVSFTIVNRASSADAVLTLNAATGDNIDGASSIEIPVGYQVRVQSLDDTRWSIMDDSRPGSSGSGLTSVSVDTDHLSGDGTSASPVSVASGGIGTTELADDSVTNAKLADDSVTNAKLADDSVNSDQIADDAVTVDKVADAVIARLLPALPSTGSRDNRIPVFNSDTLEWALPTINEEWVTLTHVAAGGTTAVGTGAGQVRTTDQTFLVELTGPDYGTISSYVTVIIPRVEIPTTGSFGGDADTFAKRFVADTFNPTSNDSNARFIGVRMALADGTGTDAAGTLYVTPAGNHYSTADSGSTAVTITGLWARRFTWT